MFNTGKANISFKKEIGHLILPTQVLFSTSIKVHKVVWKQKQFTTYEANLYKGLQIFFSILLFSRCFYSTLQLSENTILLLIFHLKPKEGLSINTQ